MDDASPAPPARRADGPDPDLIASLYARTPAALLGHAAGALALLLLFWTWAPPARLLGWLIAFSAAWGLRMAVAQRYRRAQPARDAQRHWRYWQAAWNGSSLACGGGWALAGAIFYQAGQGFHDTALILLAYSYCIGSPATSYRVFVTYTLMCFAPMVAHVAAEGLPHSLPMAGLIAGGFLVTLVIGRQYRRAFDSLLALKIGNEQLAAQLADEKAAAEAARSQAEEANRAKTRFLAAASHDLRQPLHALALFAETLRQRAQEDDTAQLAGSIAESVALLETLFGELLDLSRLDAGGVEPHARHFPMRELYDRLRPHVEPQAFDKGLALRFRGAERWVHADPLLVERVLRNLVANAVRYTEDGGVLVGCRPQGATLRLEVWDSGVGIPADALPHIFDEFYQVGPARSMAGAPSGGSGLGLAIAQRLARLVGSGLQVASVPGRGSVFRLELPAGRPQPPV
ncbi:MAG TPA: HAMP domain-containing sensor histidine kinase, partial [Burkholderiaceae bacterium]|nr:HAMP domain-containing sensor histidine kinase [Burkholderiaceae bacterium]